ncbi:MAG: transposase [Prevotella sp.]|jgi:REP element-mobilizing transposase RayT|nr:transposase [Prevotella sp.]
MMANQRRSIRLNGYNYSQEGLYFVTICAKDKLCLFGSVINDEMVLNDTGKIAYDCWIEIPRHYQNVVLHEFVIMPNHIHGILEIVMPSSVGVEYFRPDSEDKHSMNNSEDIRVENIRPLQQRPNCKSGAIGAIIRGFKIGITKQIGYSIWQRNYYEHIIRNDESHRNITEYIYENPKNWIKDDYYT